VLVFPDRGGRRSEARDGRAPGPTAQLVPAKGGEAPMKGASAERKSLVSS
jgi:hypothetical protein